MIFSKDDIQAWREIAPKTLKKKPDEEIVAWLEKRNSQGVLEI